MALEDSINIGTVQTDSSSEIRRPLRERLVRQGPQALSSEELLAVILQADPAHGDGVSVAGRLAQKFNGIAGLSRATMKDLSRLRWIGPHRAATIVAAIELGRRVSSRSMEGPRTVSTPDEAADLLIPRLSGLEKEQVLAVMLDTKNVVIGIHTVSIGTLTASLVHPREVFLEAIKANAASIIVAHNHPSGDPSPSTEDRRVTVRLVESGQLLGIEVVDHLIIGEGRWVSLKRLGVF